MFDSPHVFEPLLNSEQAAAIVKVHPKTLQRYARNGIVGGLRVGKL
jgi:predicted site-specific integrase-resolvase